MESPVLSGYENRTIPVYFNQAPVLTVTPRDTMNLFEGVDTSVVNQAERNRARVLLRFHSQADSLLVSGLLVAGDELAGSAAVVDAPVGKGHVVLFGIRPMWRWESQGTFALVLNAIANWNSLGSDAPKPLAATPSDRGGGRFGCAGASRCATESRSLRPANRRDSGQRRAIAS